ncbi:stage II sporulation protein M [Oxobacter pfennigii]|uniref:Stage II sporulation protein M n=1 Tax=Oxobacter pfennigii TaxID=36849 RepID=A0A0P8X239_9CLOT|nr:stage II sporulation protein M [Oxobacter pfennigii]KPU44877.1 stage II sporulation protein M [Oxobacter pfennigii]
MFKSKRLKETISNHVKSNMFLYSTVILFFSIGVAAGAFTVKSIDDVQKQSLINYLEGFFQILTNTNVDSMSVLSQSIKNNLQTSFIIWILGITVIGIPIALLIIGIRGFIIGFTVAFLINGLGLKGLFFTFSAIVPHNLIVIPCMIASCVISISFSMMIIKDRLAKRWTNNYWQKFFSYCLLMIILFIISIMGSLIEAYIIPVFIKLISNYLAP